MMTPVTSVEQFQTTIAQKTPTFVLFGSPTCPWCQKQKPVVEAFSAKYPRLTTLFVDVTVWPEIASRRKIASLPTLFLFEKGKSRGRAEGFHTAREVEQFVEGALP